LATVSKEMAMEIIANDGYYPGDPRVTKVVKYDNAWSKECWALIWEFEDQMRYERSPATSNVVTVWVAS
jgi:hypothetical protein